MFGYIVINQSEMKFKEYDVYRSYYCGLCQSLKERYGVLGQLSLNYDMTFILMLLTGLYEPEEQEAQCRCVAHPLEKHPTRRNLFTDYVADMTVLFSYKAEDDWEDEHSLKGLVYSYLLGRKFRKKPLLYQEKVRNISLAMQDFADAEKQGNADIDTMAGLFGRVMAQIVSCREDEWKDNLERLGFFLGKFIYLLDAYEDIEQDLSAGNGYYCADRTVSGREEGGADRQYHRRRNRCICSDFTGAVCNYGGLCPSYCGSHAGAGRGGRADRSLHPDLWCRNLFYRGI